MCLDLAVILAIFTKVDTLGGWSGVEVALLFGLSGVAFGMADLSSARWRTPRATSRRARSTCSSCARAAAAAPHRLGVRAPADRAGRSSPSSCWSAPSCSSPSTGARQAVAARAGHARGRHGDLRRRVGRDVGDLVLDGGEPGDGQRLHLRREPGHAVPHRRARRVAPPPLHLRVPARLRRLPPGRRIARQADAARAARLDRVGRRRSSRVARRGRARAPSGALAVRHHQSTGS